MKRCLALFLCFVMCFSLLPTWAMAEGEEPVEQVEEQGADMPEEGEPEGEVPEEPEGEAEVAVYEEPPHEHAWEVTVTEPTCTEQGYTTYTCDCGESYTDNYVDSLNHPETEEIPEVPASCTEAGVAAGLRCLICGEIIQGCEEIPALGHTPEDVAEVPATTEATGMTAGTRCSVCGAILSGCEEIPMLEAVAEPEPEEEPEPVQETEPVEEQKPERDPEAEAVQEEKPAQETPAEPEPEQTQIEEPVVTIVQVIFTVTPENAELTVYSKDEQGEKIEYEPEPDGSYLLLPGVYYYTLTAVDYEPVEETELTVEESDEPFMIEIIMEKELITEEVGGKKATEDAANAVTTSGYCGSYVDWEFDDATGTLRIFGTGEMYDYEDHYISNSIYYSNPDLPWYTFKDSILAVIIEEGVTSIGDNVFFKCSKLESVSVPDSVTRIGTQAFFHCTSLRSVSMPGTLDSIGKNAFYNCKSLESIVIPNGVTRLETDTFWCCSNLSYLALPDSLTSITMGTNYGALYQCEKLLSAGPTGSGCNIEYSWQNEIPAHVFSYVPLTSIIIDDGITEIGACAFSSCSSLDRITIPESVTKIGSGAFSNCTGLQSITFEGNMPTVDDIASVFSGVSASVYYPCNKNGYTDSMTEETGLTCIAMHDWGEGTVSREPTCGQEGELLFVCNRDHSHTRTEPIVEEIAHTPGEAVVENKKAACTSEGSYDEVIYCLICGNEISRETKKVPVTGHAYGAVTYTWSSDNKTVTAKRVCANDASHVETEKATATSITTKQATYSAKGRATYTASFRNSNFAEQTKTVDIPKKTVGVPTVTVSNTKTGVQIKWAAVSDADGYRVFRKGPNDSTWKKLVDVTGVTYIDTSAVSGTTYSYAVKTRVTEGNGTFWSAYSGGKTIRYVSAPVISSVTDVKAGVSVKWSAVNGAEKYRVLRKGPSDAAWKKLADTTGTNYTDKTVVSGTKYSYAVRCVTGDGSRVASVSSAARAITYIAAPVISGISRTTAGVQIKWSKVPGAAKYRVFRKEPNSTGWTKIGDTTAVTYTDKTAKSGTKYSYAVRCIDSGGTLRNTYSAEKSITYVATPKISSVSNTGNNTVTIQWRKLTGVTGYQIQYSIKEDFSKVQGIKIAKAATVSRAVNNLIKNKTYFVRMRAYYTAGSSTVYSAWSAASSVKISKGNVIYLAGVPELTAQSTQNEDSRFTVHASWSALQNADGYELSYKNSQNGSWKVAGRTSGKSRNITVEHGAKYSFRVRAYRSRNDGTVIYSKYSEVTEVKCFLKPTATFVLSDKTRTTSTIMIAIKNTSPETLRITSEFGYLNFGTDSPYNRELTLFSGNKDGVHEILPGEKAYVTFRVVGSKTLYQNGGMVSFSAEYDSGTWIGSATNSLLKKEVLFSDQISQ